MNRHNAHGEATSSEVPSEGGMLITEAFVNMRRGRVLVVVSIDKDPQPIAFSDQLPRIRLVRGFGRGLQ